MVSRAVLMKSGQVSLNTIRQVNTAHPKITMNSARPKTNLSKIAHSTGNPQMDLQDQGVIDSGCSRHMTGNMSYLTDYEEIDGGYVAFGGNPKGGKITGRGTIKTGNLDFENVYFVRELKFNLFSVSQMCDKKNSVLFNDTECIVLSPNFKLTDESHVLLKVPRKNNMYSVDLKNIVPKGGLTCLFAKATSDESELWHRRLGHINFKTMNKLVKGNLVRGLPLKLFEIHQTCVACQKGKQHRASSRTPQQNGVAERKNRTLIEAARTMLADSKLPTTFWAEAVNTACYVQNRVLVTKPHNKTPYELFLGRKPDLGFMRPFGCLVIIINTIDHLGEFDGKANEGFFVGYSINRSGPNWLFDIDALTKSMNYKLVVTGNQSNGNAGTKACDDAGDDEKKVTKEPGKEGGDSSKDSECSDQEKEDNVNSTNIVNAASTNEVNTIGAKTSIELPDDPNMPELEDIVYSDDDEDVGAEADMNNLNPFMPVSPIPTTRVHKDHPVEQIIGDLNSDNAQIEYNEIGVNAGDSKLMLLGINLLLLGKVNVARHKLTAAVEMDGKKIIITEASIRSDLKLNDEEGMDCLPNGTIFEELTRMGHIAMSLSLRTNAWNKFSSTMTSAIICLATNQKFNFSKYIFKSMVKNLDNASKFLMYPRKGFRNGKHYVSNNGGARIKLEIVKIKKDTVAPQPSGPTTNVADKVVYEERDDSLEMAATTTTGLDAEQDRGMKINDIDKDVEITLVDETQGRVSTLAQALAALKSAKVQEKANVIEELRESITTTPTLTTITATTTITTTSTRPKAKGLVIHEEEQYNNP
ncbi:ribonuclease H-like domain-containing protein [Tanacetum coccineum]|uniref:Ribonuclease H-like domain-containing protein n=1 Tax=Tanacetum coccineum TaxID=301880 RepID=A0ABQ4ZZU2_9ASTR